MCICISVYGRFWSILLRYAGIYLLSVLLFLNQSVFLLFMVCTCTCMEGIDIVIIVGQLWMTCTSYANTMHVYMIHVQAGR